MNISFDGMNQWTATFATSDAVEGHVVKMTAGATVGACARRRQLLRRYRR